MMVKQNMTLLIRRWEIIGSLREDEVSSCMPHSEASEVTVSLDSLRVDDLITGTHSQLFLPRNVKAPDLEIEAPVSSGARSIFAYYFVNCYLFQVVHLVFSSFALAPMTHCPWRLSETILE